MKPLSRASLAIAVFACGFVGCDRGDYFGPVERSLRAAFWGWDMWQTPGVRPYELPMPLPPAGSVPTTRRHGFNDLAAKFAELDPKAKAARAKTAYRHYCQHCHGEHGDGRTVVGESFSAAPADFRISGAYDQDPADLYSMAEGGSGEMLALGGVVDPEEIFFAVGHVPDLRDAPSEPVFKPKYAQPIR